MDISPQMIGTSCICIMVLLMFLRVPVAFAMLFVGFSGYWIISGSRPALRIIGYTFFDVFSNYGYSAVPLFIFMGFLSFYSGILTKLFDVSKKWVGHLPGGLVQATIIGGAGFGAMCGSGAASTATLARIVIPEVVKSGVKPKLVYGAVSSVGPLASLIPPSVIAMILAIASEQSIGKVLIGGLIPGILTALFYVILVFVMVRRNPAIAPIGPKTTLSEKLTSLKHIWDFSLLVLIIVAGLYSGIFTPTEAGAIGAFTVLVIVLIRHGLAINDIKDALIETIKTTSTIF